LAWNQVRFTKLAIHVFMLIAMQYWRDFWMWTSWSHFVYKFPKRRPPKQQIPLYQMYVIRSSYHHLHYYDLCTV